MTKKKVLEAEPFPVLKIKVGLDKDEATMEAILSVTKKPLRVDANEGFKSKEERFRKIKWLEGLGVELIESLYRPIRSKKRSGCAARCTCRSSRMKLACISPIFRSWRQLMTA